MQQPQIILLKEGTDTSQGKAQLISNINACCAVVDAVRTTLGPRGMDKLIHDQKVIPTILYKLLPIAMSLVQRTSVDSKARRQSSTIPQRFGNRPAMLEGEFEVEPCKRLCRE